MIARLTREDHIILLGFYIWLYIAIQIREELYPNKEKRGEKRYFFSILADGRKTRLREILVVHYGGVLWLSHLLIAKECIFP